MRILLIEDDTVTAHSIQLALKLENISLDWARLGKDGVELGKFAGCVAALREERTPCGPALGVCRPESHPSAS
jgi:DNA-binding response OmpR family regulator